MKQQEDKPQNGPHNDYNVFSQEFVVIQHFWTMAMYNAGKKSCGELNMSLEWLNFFEPLYYGVNKKSMVSSEKWSSLCLFGTIEPLWIVLITMASCTVKWF